MEENKTQLFTPKGFEELKKTIKRRTNSKRTPNKIKKTIIENCCRCKGTHEVKVYKFTIPMVIKDEIFDFWAVCPKTEEPILIKIVDIKET
jgi:hypothetical protein